MDTRRRERHFVLAAIIGGLALAAGACSSDSDGEGSPVGPDPPAASGSIEVTIATIGDELDLDGYSLVVDGGAGQATTLDQELTLTDLTVGAHGLELTGVAANCRVTNVANPTPVAVSDGGPAQVSYLVFCLPPDAGRIFYVGGGNASLQSIAAIGGDSRIIGPTGIQQFSVSRSGSRIVYIRQTADGLRLFVQDADGSNSTLVTEETEPSPISRPDLSPDGTRIVFTARAGDLFLINVDGSGSTNLTNGNPGPNAFHPAWSPDGDRIVFSAPSDASGCFLGLSDENAPLYIMNSDGSGIQPLTNPPNGIYHFSPEWSPDGNEIAYSACRDTSPIFVVNADGSGLRPLMPDVNNLEAPSWSPDGRWIAFSSDGIYVMRADGSDVVQLTFGGERSPQWR